ncbi:MAG: hypothetical protein MZV64_44005 [Ignavibacteriales bacterium]|nr:hypothetical protein [Ignavibacteriales bacterium]
MPTTSADECRLPDPRRRGRRSTPPSRRSSIPKSRLPPQDHAAPLRLGAYQRPARAGLIETAGRGSASTLLLAGNTTVQTLEAWYSTEVFLGRRFDIERGLRLVASSWLTQEAVSLSWPVRRGNPGPLRRRPLPGIREHGATAGVTLQALRRSST